MGTPIFFSLRWQVILPVVAMLALVTLVFGWEDYLSRRKTFALEQTQEQRHQTELLAQLQQDRGRQAETLAGMLVNLPTLRAAFLAERGTKLTGSFLPYWDELNLGVGLEAAVFSNASHEPIASFGPPVLSNFQASLMQHLRRAEHEEQAIAWMACTRQCLLLVALPVVEGGNFRGTLTLALSLQELIFRFRQMTESELAVLAPPNSMDKAPVAAFDKRLVSISGPNHLERALDALEIGGQDGAYKLLAAGQHYSVVRVAKPDSDVEFLIFRDVTARMQAISRANWANLQAASLVLGVSVVLIYLTLLRPLGRLRRGVAVLPLLGEARYAQVQAVTERTHGSLRDEVDEVLHAAKAAATSLANLEAVQKQQTALLEQSEASLRDERDFMTSLLDTAPVFIITHDLGGHMQQINAQALRVGLACNPSASNKPSLQEAGFLNAFIPPLQHDSLHGSLLTLAPGEVHNNEARLTLGSQELTVVWAHTRVQLAQSNVAFLSVGVDMSAHRAAERQVTHLRDHDALTGLQNRSAFLRDLRQIVQSGARHGVLLACDLDQFKSVNEAVGMVAGDSLLVEFARLARSLQPSPKRVARLGADDFVLYVETSQPVQVQDLVQQLNNGLLGVGTRLDLPKQNFTVCVGVVRLEPGSQVSVTDHLARAEAALVVARGKGQGHCHVFESGSATVDHENRLYWSDEIDDALQNSRFTHYYQPILQVQSQEIAHWECLIRMKPRSVTDKALVIAPGKFMPVAEATGQVRLTDRWGLTNACRQLSLMRDIPNAHLSVNLSGRSLDDDSTLDTLREALQEYRVAGDKLIIEITETHALADIQAAAQLMKRFRDLGCRFSLDDFGVGYTSFRYLKELPVDYVKIDGAFISGLATSIEDQLFVQALTQAVHGFGKLVVAEFVEDQATLNLLARFDVDYAQGYHVGKPMPQPIMAIAGSTI